MLSVCHEVYRKIFMPENTIALLPAFGYQKHDASSFKAFLWLKYMSVKNNIQIKHSRNGGEQRIDNYKMDGMMNLIQLMNFMDVFFTGVRNVLIIRHSTLLKMNL